MAANVYSRIEERLFGLLALLRALGRAIGLLLPTGGTGLPVVMSDTSPPPPLPQP